MASAAAAPMPLPSVHTCSPLAADPRFEHCVRCQRYYELMFKLSSWDLQALVFSYLPLEVHVKHLFRSTSGDVEVVTDNADVSAWPLPPEYANEQMWLKDTKTEWVVVEDSSTYSLMWTADASEGYFFTKDKAVLARNFRPSYMREIGWTVPKHYTGMLHNMARQREGEQEREDIKRAKRESLLAWRQVAKCVTPLPP